MSNSETIGNINIDRINSNSSLPDRVEGIIDNGKTSDFRLQTSDFERSDCVPPPEKINSEDLAETAKNAQTDSSSELDEVALKGCSIYSDPQVPPTQNINTDDLVASLLDRSEELITFEIPTDDEPQPGDRVYSPITEQKGILQSFGGSYSSVLWDGTKTARSIYSHVIQKLEKIEVLRSELIDAVSSLRNIITNSKVIKLIKKLPESTITLFCHSGRA